MTYLIRTLSREVAEAGPNGMSLDEACVKHPEVSRHGLSMALNRAAAHGYVHKPMRGTNSAQPWFFGQAEWSEAWLQRNAHLLKRRPVPRGARGREEFDQCMSSVFHRDRKRVCPEGEGVVTERTRITVLPTQPGRFEVPDTTHGEFERLGIGRYSEQPSRWVRQVVGVA